MREAAGGGACLLDRLVAVRQSSRPHQADDLARQPWLWPRRRVKCTRLSLVASRMPERG